MILSNVFEAFKVFEVLGVTTGEAEAQTFPLTEEAEFIDKISFFFLNSLKIELFDLHGD